MQRSLPAIVTFCLAVVPLVAHAQDTAQPTTKVATGPTSLGGAKAWAAYTASEKNSVVCYVVGKPTKSQPATVPRRRVDVQVTHRPGEKQLNVVDFELGYTVKTGSSAELVIDGKKFTLFTNKDSAWASDPATDKAVTNALAKGKQATLKAVSDRGTSTTDTYSLAGFGPTLALADKACNVKR
jgi:putative intracellular protease/amidase